MLEGFRAVAPGIVDFQPMDTRLPGSPLTKPALECVLKTKKTRKLEESTTRLHQLTALAAGLHLPPASHLFPPLRPRCAAGNVAAVLGSLLRGGALRGGFPLQYLS